MSKQETPAKPQLSPQMRRFMRVSGIFAAILFLTPTFYAVKYAALDSPRETRLIQQFDRRKWTDTHVTHAFPVELHQRLQLRDPDNIPLLSRVAQQDEDPVFRRDAVVTLGHILMRPGVSLRRPIEALQGKAALAYAAAHDIDPEVQAEARRAIDAIAAGGAVVRR